MAYEFFERIRGHVNIGLIHDTQDDRPVVANDPVDNSRQLVNKGSDPLTQETYKETYIKFICAMAKE
ncbi:hypothetical protein OKW29_004775 [Paraburkholderia sp. CI3]